MAKNYLYNLLLTVSNILFPILSFPYAAKILGPEGIGKVQFLISFSQYFALLAALGIPIYGIQEIAKNKGNKVAQSRVFSELFSIFFLTSLLFSAVYLLIIFSFSYFSSSIDLYVYAGLIILLGFSYTDWFYSGIEDFKSIALRSVGIKAFSLILLYTFVKERSDYIYYLLITVFSISGNHISGLVSIGKRVNISFTNLNLKRHFTPLLYILNTTIASSMYTILDVVLLGFLSNNKAVGYYTAAVKLTKITLPFVTSMGVILIPGISGKLAGGQHDEVEKLLRQAFDFMILISVPTVTGLIFLSPEFLTIFSGHEFLPATFSMQILSLLPLIIGFGHFFTFLILVPAGKNREMFFSVMTGMFVGLLLNFVLIPKYAETGAAIANVVTELIVSASYFYYVKKYFNYRYNWKLLLNAGLASLPFIPMIILIRWGEFNLVFSLIFSVLGCAFLYSILQLFLFRNRLAQIGLRYILKGVSRDRR
jgi:O-antigen/teichoic acid export membrane protein